MRNLRSGGSSQSFPKSFQILSPGYEVSWEIAARQVRPNSHVECADRSGCFLLERGSFPHRFAFLTAAITFHEKSPKALRAWEIAEGP